MGFGDSTGLFVVQLNCWGSIDSNGFMHSNNSISQTLNLKQSMAQERKRFVFDIDSKSDKLEFQISDASKHTAKITKKAHLGKCVHLALTVW